MKSVVIAATMMLIVALQSSVLLANEAKEIRAEAERYYAGLNYKKAFKKYLILAKSGDRYSQDRVSHMYAKGQGKSVDLVDSYAWAALAAEGNDEKLAKLNNELLPQIKKPSKAEKKAAKLIKRYGKKAQAKRTANHNKRGRVLDEGSCTGSKLACPRK